MNRRVSLPGADELFRSTGNPVTPLRPDPVAPDPGGATDPPPPPADAIGASGRTRHDAKMTVYLTPQELLDLEQARLRLRADFGIAIDRGRIVREAIAELLEDLRDAGPDSKVVRNLS